MAAKKIITIPVLLLSLSLQLSAEDKPKSSKFHAVSHWVATHKKVMVISVGAAAATGFALRNSAGSKQVPFTPRIKCTCGGQPAQPTP